MTASMILTYLGGYAIITTAVALMFWQILSSPDRPNYPTSGRVKRTFMFAYMVFLYGRGVEILDGIHDPTPILLTEYQVSAALAQCGLFVTFLVDHCRNWLPARQHRAIRRMLSIARCSPSPALKQARTSAMKSSTGEPCPAADVVGPAILALAMSGATVVAPNESVESFNDR